MENLAQIESIKNRIKTAPRKSILALYKLIFEEDGDRGNRNKLREFSGFEFEMNSDEYSAKIEYAARFPVGDLISICNILGLDYTGDKETLRQKIVRSLINLNSLVPTNDETDDNNTEDDDDEDEEGAGTNENNNEEIELEEAGSVPIKREKNKVHFTVGFKDVEETIRDFKGDDDFSVERWVADFEDAASLFGWSDLQKVIFAKKSLKGLAKLFVLSETGLNKWAKLKNALIDEFSIKITSAQLHNMLSETKMKESDNVYEYFLRIKEIASRGNIEIEAVYDYVINGIIDSPSNKIILYGAKSVSEFKEKLKYYEKIREKNGKKNQVSLKDKINKHDNFDRTTKTNRATDNNNNNRCFNCGIKGHKSKDCRNKKLGTKCFRCNNFGHVAANCKSDKQTENSEVSVTSVTVVKDSIPYKEVCIENVKFDALIDTGSPISLIKENVINKLSNVELRIVNKQISGFGKGQSMAKQYFNSKIEIDSCEYWLDFYVVPNDAMSFTAIIGRDIMDQAELNFNKDGVEINKIWDDGLVAAIDLPQDTEIAVEEICNKDMRDKVRNLINLYKPKKTKSTGIELTVTLKNDKVVYSKPRRLSFYEQEIVDKQVQEWLRMGIVRSSSSEYTSPVLIRLKKDGTHRLCIDFRLLNAIVNKDRHPIPIIEEQIDKLQNAKIFSILDLKNGFFHVNVSESSRKYLSFVTPTGQYEFLKTPFGFCNSPPVFQRFINHIFRELVNQKIVVVYFDDVIILADNLNEAFERLRAVFELCSSYGLEINFKKCKFMKERVEYLGQVIEKGTVSPSKDKVCAVVNYPEPKSLKEVQSFLGLSGYFRKFIQSYSMIAGPLSDLLKKDRQFHFGDNERKSFAALKVALTSSPVLKIFDRNLPTEVHTDASKEGFGAVLLQRQTSDDKLYPVHYMSRKTTPAQRNRHSYELEAVAVVEAVKKFRSYLLGKEFKIVTDCLAFNQTLKKKEVSPKVWRWVEGLQEFNYTIEHRAGSKMLHVDALSRHTVLSIEVDDITARVSKLQDEDDELKLIKQTVQGKADEKYSLRGGLLYKMVDGLDVLVVPSAMENDIIQGVHEKGHISSLRTQEAIKQEYFIPQLKFKVDKYIANCVRCIIGNQKEGKKEGFLHPLQKPDVPLHTFHMDHLGPLQSTSKRYNHILAIIDSFSKFVWLYPTRSTTTDEVIDRLSRQKSTFGNPSCIVTDRGTAFTSEQFQAYCNDENITHARITTGLPRSNGQVERINRSIIPILTKLSADDPSKWFKHVEKLQYTINSTFQRSIATTPFELLTGVKMRCKEDVHLKDIIEKQMQEQFVEDRQEQRLAAKEQILKTQQENQRTYNLRRRNPMKYKEGDLVAIKRTQMVPGKKLKAKYLGPYRIIKVKGNDTYNVERAVDGEGPQKTSTCAEFMKQWVN